MQKYLLFIVFYVRNVAFVQGVPKKRLSEAAAKRSRASKVAIVQLFKQVFVKHKVKMSTSLSKNPKPKTVKLNSLIFFY